jgi:hypothetical protein
VKRILLGGFLLAGATILCPAYAVDYTPTGDIRVGLFGRDRDDRDSTSDTRNELRARLRFGVDTVFSENVRARLRFAGRYSSREDIHEFTVTQSIQESDGLRLGDSTIDELYVRIQPDSHWDIRAGRMQTKFELVGIPRKSLTRNDSPNTDITWTDGIHAKYHDDNGWDYHGILQRSVDDGPTTVRRSPLAFTEDASHITYYFGMEEIDKKARIVQRGFDITYIPDSLRKDGTESGRIRDYYGISGKIAAQFPLQSLADHLLLGGEIAWAPETPTETTVKTGTSGDSNGYAFQTSINLMDIRPGHSFGLVYVRAEGGWLLSADVGNNQHLLEGRYKWQISRSQKLEIRLRERDDLDKLAGSSQKRKDLDYYVRYTWKF